MTHATLIAKELQLKLEQVERTVALLGGRGDLAVHRALSQGGDRRPRRGADRRDRGAARPTSPSSRRARQTILARSSEQGKLTVELRARIEATLSKTELEDLYLPYKPKRRTRATIARERGLEPLAELIWAQDRGRRARARRWPRRSSTRRGEVRRRGGARGRARHRGRAGRRARRRARGAARAALDSASVVVARQSGQGGGGRRSSRTTSTSASRPRASRRTACWRSGAARPRAFCAWSSRSTTTRALDLVRHQVAIAPKRAARRASSTRRVVDAYERLLKPSIEVDVRLQLKERADARGDPGLRREPAQPAARGAARRQAACWRIDPGFRTGCKVAVDRRDRQPAGARR